MFFAVGRSLGVHHQKVERCVERALADGPLAALDDRPHPGREPTITPEAKAWLVSLACDKAKDHGYPHELWTTRLLGRHAREHGPAMGHDCLSKPIHGMAKKILGQEEIKPHKVRYYLERRDVEFEQKMADVLCIYREVQILKKTAAKSNKPGKSVAIVSYDEKPGIQAIATTAPDLPPEPGVHATFARDHEYKRHGTLSLLAGMDLITGKVQPTGSRPSPEFIAPQASRCAYPARTAIKLVCKSHSCALSRKKPELGSPQPAGRAEADNAVGAVVVTGRGKAFCAGFNLKEIPIKDLDVEESPRTFVWWRCGGIRSFICSPVCPSRSSQRSTELRRVQDWE